MFRTQNFFTYGQSTLLQRQCFVVLTKVTERACEIAHTRCRIRMFRTQNFFTYGQSTLLQRQCFVVLTKVTERSC